MKKLLNILCVAAALALGVPLHAQQLIYPQGNGGDIGNSATQVVGFHGAVATGQRNSVAQNALSITCASGTLTITGTPAAQAYASDTLSIPVLPSAGDSVTVGGTGAAFTYTFQNAFSGTSNQVLIANDPADTLENLIGAILYSQTGGQQAGVTYQLSGTVANTTVKASLTPGSAGVSANIFALSSGTAGNALGTTSSFTSGSNAFSAATLSGGAAGNSVVIGTGTYTFAAWLNPAVPNLVLDSGSSGSVANLIAAVDATPGLAGIAYSLPTVSSTSAIASSGTASNIAVLTAILGGTNGNNLVFTGTTANISISGTTGTFLGGTQFTDTNAEANLLNEIRAALVAKGLIKGSN